MTVAIYIRVSTEEQVKEGYSISAQRERLKAYCQVQDWTDFKFYIDEGISAKDTNRPYLQLMNEHIKQGMIDTVLVYRLDRLTRSVLDLYKLLEFFEEHNCKFKSATEVYDTSSAMGRLFITLVAALAQWERENLGERVRMGQIEKARQGEYSAKAPFGFDKGKDIGKNGDKEKYKLFINDDEKRVIEEMVEKIKEGYSIRQLARYLDDEMGIAPIRGYQWHIRTVLDILKNPAIYGATKWRDEIIEDTHQGIITKAQYDQLQIMLNQRQNAKKRQVHSFFIYQMKLLCPVCGNHLTSERSKYLRKKDGKYSEHNRYRCQPCALNKRKAISVSEKRIESGFVQYMKQLKFEKVPSYANDNKEEKERIKLTKQIEKIKKQREKYQKAWAADVMTDDEFFQRSEETKNAIAALEEQLNAIQPNVNVQQVDNGKLKELVNNFNKNWNELAPKEKNQFLNMFIQEIHFAKDGTNAIVTNVVFMP